ncbi:hypothetical protein C8J57DRAFT_1327243 [Mycena rebaudengoi]|nr:hypothetical protein C8J57DRAFT_1327243 [Mycena rebaudengoi]
MRIYIRARWCRDGVGVVGGIIYLAYRIDFLYVRALPEVWCGRGGGRGGARGLASVSVGVPGKFCMSVAGVYIRSLRLV